MTNEYNNDFNKKIDNIINRKLVKSLADIYTYLEEGNFITEKNDSSTNFINVSE
jgi:hypothetical protein